MDVEEALVLLEGRGNLGPGPPKGLHGHRIITQMSYFLRERRRVKMRRKGEGAHGKGGS